MSARDVLAAVERAEQQAHATHVAGQCGASEWSCSWCEVEQLAPAARFAVVSVSELPDGHEFVIVRQDGQPLTCFSAPSIAAQRHAREAVVEWIEQTGGAA